MAETPRRPGILFDLAKLAERLRIQESANRQAGGGITGGALVIYDLDGNLIGFLGELDEGGGVTGIQLAHPEGAGMFHVSDAFGWAYPYLPTSWVRTTDAATTTSGTFESLFRCRIEQATGLHFRFNVYFTTPVGTTAEIRVTKTGVAYPPIYSVPSGHAAWHEWAYPLEGDLYAGPYEMALQGRITSGAGPLTVYLPYDLAQGYYTNVIPVTGWIS